MNSRLSAVFFGSAFAGMAMLTLLDAALKGFVLFAAATLVVLALRRASAATRHIVWLSVLVCSLLLPFCAWFLPRWRVLPAWMSWEEIPKRLSVVALPPGVVRGTQPANFPAASDNEAPAAITLPTIAPSRPPFSAAPMISGIRLNAQTILLVWMGGATLPLAAVLYSLARLRRLSAEAGVVTQGLLAVMIRDLQVEIGFCRKVRLLVGKSEVMPMVWGVVRPSLLLPAEATSWAPLRLRGVLLHELAHLRRRDPLSMLLAQLALAVHWFNPLAWLAVRQLRAEQERACDDCVLRHGIRASDYASDLLAVATGLRLIRFATAAVTMADPARLEGRIAGILDVGRNRRALTRWLAVAAGLVAAAIALPLAMLRAADEKKLALGEVELGAGKKKPSHEASIASITTTAAPAETHVEEVQGGLALIAGEGEQTPVIVHEFGRSRSPIFRLSADDRPGKWGDQARLVRAGESHALMPALPDAKPAQIPLKGVDAPVPSADSPPPQIKAAKRGRLLDRNGVVLTDNAEAGARRYPFDALAVHTLGITGSERTVGRLEGRNGVELIFDAQLRKGEDVRLTLDAQLQSEVEKVLRDAGIGRGAVVILDPATGDLLASASIPNFDANAFSPSIAVEKWQALTNNPASPLVNRSLQSSPPGSTFKLVVALAACRASVMDRTYDCAGAVFYEGKAFKCWITGEKGHGKLNLREALTKSCNCYFYQLGNELGIDALAETARLLGLGARSGIGLAGESPGSIASPALLKEVDPTAKWTSGHTANAAIGHGYTEVTPLQMASIAAAIGNGGRVLIPRLVAEGAPLLRCDFAAVDCKPEHLALLRAAMRDVVIEREGTGKRARSELITLAGKTGTSQLWREEGGRKLKDNRAWFIGYAPSDSPRFAFAVLVEGGTAGGATAAPIARRIMEGVITGLRPPEPQPQRSGHVLPVDSITFAGE